jgi:hypothetical protein
MNWATVDVAVDFPYSTVTWRAAHPILMDTERSTERPAGNIVKDVKAFTRVGKALSVISDKAKVES